jgi:uncharacterized membrane protein YsdA (DUF1294 family)
MIWDKWKSKQKNEWRISEKQLLVSGAVFGSLGVIAGMLPPVHHKKRKNWFRYGMPIAFLVQLYLSYEIYVWATIRFNLYWKLPF